MVPFMRDELGTVLTELLHLIFRKDALDKAGTPLKRLSKKWLTKTKHHLEDGLVDLGAATKDLLKKAQISAERKSRFKGLCKQLMLNLVLEFWRKLPLNFCLVRNVLCLALINMIRKPEQSSICFRALTDKLSSLKKISSDVADQAKNQYDELLNLVKYEKNNEFCNFDSKKDRLDAFLAKYLTSYGYIDLWHICKLIFVMSHGQSNAERCFSVNKEVI